jgi:rod shape-determining protein MreD
VVALSLPWLLVMLGSLSPSWPIIASAPLLPPLGFLFLIAWQQLRPGIFPVWAGLPLGLFDDLYSGQPFGCAVLLWSIAMIGLEFIEFRLPWRNFLFNWLIAAGFIAGYLVLALVISNAAGGDAAMRVLVPQLAISILAYPLAARLARLFDRLRLVPLKVVE